MNYKALQKNLQDKFYYNKDTGELTRFLKHRKKIGYTVAFTPDEHSYVYHKRYYSTPQFIWIYLNGSEPPKRSYFIDGNVENLKLTNIHFAFGGTKKSKTLDTNKH